MLNRAVRARMRRCVKVTCLVVLSYAVMLNLGLIVIRPGEQNEMASLTREVVTDPPADTEDTNRDTDVLITSYMRSGSSFLGQVLGFRQDTFYVYEPLWTLSKYGYFKGDHERCDVFTTDCSKSSQLPMALQVLRQIYNCSFYMRPTASVFRDNINMKLSGPKWRSYKNCPDKQSANNTCLQQMADSTCRTSKHKVTKILRLSVRNTELVLKSNQNLKIVYLVRDPRAIINSHMRTKWSAIRRTDVDSTAAAAAAICERIEDDVMAAIDLRAKYPKRFVIVQYEDLADPLPKIKTLYQFLNMTFTSEIMNYIVKSEQRKSGQTKETETHISAALGEIQEIINKLNPEVAKRFFKSMDETKEIGKGKKKTNDEGKQGTGDFVGDSTVDDHVVEADSEEKNFYNDDIPDDWNDSDTDNLKAAVGRTLKEAKTKKGTKGSSSKDGNHPFTYRMSLPWKHVQIIDKRCERVYKLLGYRKYSSENDLWDLSVPAVTYPLPFSIE